MKLPSVEPISHVVAKPFIEKWHYSEKCPTGQNIFFGWFKNGHLYAVADYGIGVNPYQATYLTKKTGVEVQDLNMVELKRLCRVEPKNDKLPLTAFLARCHRQLKKYGYCFVVAFSDPTYGHSGGIYKAANFQYMGKTNAETHAIDKAGNIRHRRLYFRYARRKGVSAKQAREALGLELIKTKPKDRWFLQINTPGSMDALKYNPEEHSNQTQLCLFV